MKNKFIFIIIVTVLVVSIFVNFRYNKSLQNQTILLYEFNNFTLDMPIEIIEKMDDDFPNTTVTTIPISMMKSRYYLKNKRDKEAISLLKKSINQNPFLGISEFELAKYYFRKGDLDSAYYYSKSAFHKLPRNNYHSKIYFSTLTKLGKEKELDSVFNQVKMQLDFEQWKDYIYGKLELNDDNRDELKKLIVEADHFVEDRDQYNTLKVLVNIGFQSLGNLQSLILKAETLFDQNKFIESAVVYDQISKIDPSIYTHMENAAIAYLKAGKNSIAEDLFNYILKNYFNRKNSKTEFYLGLLYIDSGKKSEGCKYIEIAQKNNFAGAKLVKNKFCN